MLQEARLVTNLGSKISLIRYERRTPYPAAVVEGSRRPENLLSVWTRRGEMSDGETGSRLGRRGACFSFARLRCSVHPAFAGGCMVRQLSFLGGVRAGGHSSDLGDDEELEGLR